ncbi:MAG: hypothetical protein ACI4CS_07040 [Candidatus Weimeria sp.]
MDNDILYEYESILMGKQKIFLLSFSEHTPDKKKAFQVVWRYALEKILKWTPEDALVNIDRNIMNKLKLDRTLKCVGINTNGRLDFREILSYVYPERISNSIEEQTKNEVERVLKLGKWSYIKDPELGKFHKGFFSGEDGAKKAAVAINMVTEIYLSDLSPEDRYRFFADREKAEAFITEMKLAPVMKNFYEDPLDYYHYSLPIDRKDMMLYYEYRVHEAVKKAAEKIQKEKEKAEKEAQKEAAKAAKKAKKRS